MIRVDFLGSVLYLNGFSKEEVCFNVDRIRMDINVDPKDIVLGGMRNLDSAVLKSGIF